jgi:Predicted acyltransferases
LRKYDIDNIRSLAILLLFPFHTCRMFTSLDPFYVVGKPSIFCDYFIRVTSEWFMPLLFAVAGISAALAMEKRTARQFMWERYYKLLVPFFFGLFLIIPAQTFFAEKQHNGYTGNYFEQYILFFTKQTDLSGYTGGFTPGHLWFLFFLFLISSISLPIILIYNKSENKINVGKFNLFTLILLFLFNFVLSPIAIADQSFGKYLSVFLLGYFVLRNDDVMSLLESRRIVLSILAVTFSALRIIAGNMGWSGISYPVELLLSAFNALTTWVIILAILGMGKRYLNFSNKATAYFAKASFPVYVFHQTWLVAIGYYIINAVNITALQFSMIMILGFAASLMTYEVFRRISVTRFMFGIKK